MRIRSVLVFISVLCLFSNRSSSQPQTDSMSSSPSMGWVTLGVGLSGNRDFFGLTANLSASYFSALGLLRLRLVNATGFPGEETPTRLQSHTSRLLELSGMYGLSHRTSFLLLSVSSGIGMVRMREYTPNGQKVSTTLGIPLEGEVLITPLPTVGVGMNVFGNLNGKSSYWGVLSCISLGKLW
jgi:hypothetical protein